MFNEYKLKNHKDINRDNTIRNIIITFIFVVIMVIIFVSCKPIERVITNTDYKTEYREILQRDSMYIHDSIYIRERGDTLWIEKFKYIYKNVYLRDTINKTDTVKYIITDTKHTTTNVMYWWQKYSMYIGFAVILYGFIWMVIKLRNIWGL